MPIEVTPYPFGRKGMLPYTPPIPVEAQHGPVVTGGAPPSVIDAASNTMIPPGPGAVASKFDPRSGLVSRANPKRPTQHDPALPDAGYTAPPGHIGSSLMPNGYGGVVGHSTGTPSLAMLREREMAGESMYGGGSVYGGPAAGSGGRSVANSALAGAAEGSMYGGASRINGSAPSMAGWADTVSQHFAPGVAASNYGRGWMSNTLPAPRRGAVSLAGEREPREAYDMRHRHREVEGRATGGHRRSHDEQDAKRLRHAEREHQERERRREEHRQERLSDASFYARSKTYPNHPHEHREAPKSTKEVFSRQNASASPRSVHAESPRSPSASPKASRRECSTRGQDNDVRLSPGSSHHRERSRHRSHSNSHSPAEHQHSPAAPSPLSIGPGGPLSFDRARNRYPLSPKAKHQSTLPSHIHHRSSGSRHSRSTSVPHAAEQLQHSMQHLQVNDGRSYYTQSARGPASAVGTQRPRAHSQLPHPSHLPPSLAHMPPGARAGDMGGVRRRSLSMHEYPINVAPPTVAHHPPAASEVGRSGALGLFAASLGPRMAASEAGVDELGASVAGSQLTFLDAPMGGRTSQYGLPKYGYQPQPDHRRFMLQRGKADVHV